MSFFLIIFSRQISNFLLLFSRLNPNRQLIIQVRKKVLDWLLEYGRGSLVVFIKVLNILDQGRISGIYWSNRIHVSSRWTGDSLVRSVDDRHIRAIIVLKVIWVSPVTYCIYWLKIGMNDLFLYPTWIPLLGLWTEFMLRLIKLQIIFGLEDVGIDLFFLRRFLQILVLLCLLLLSTLLFALWLIPFLLLWMGLLIWQLDWGLVRRLTDLRRNKRHLCVFEVVNDGFLLDLMLFFGRDFTRLNLRTQKRTISSRSWVFVEVNFLNFLWALIGDT